MDFRMWSQMRPEAGGGDPKRALGSLLFWRSIWGPCLGPRSERNRQTWLHGLATLFSSKLSLRPEVKGLIVFLADPFRILMGYLKSLLAKSPTAFRKGELLKKRVLLSGCSGIFHLYEKGVWYSRGYLSFGGKVKSIILSGDEKDGASVSLITDFRSMRSSFGEDGGHLSILSKAEEESGFRRGKKI